MVVFPGSNCELDCRHALESLGAEAELVWHDDELPADVDIVVLPGGFAHGDYL
ncbi:MAG: phosphoribosylformylglycinamidine synthase I, partial [Actinomycetota bacterium]